MPWIEHRTTKEVQHVTDEIWQKMEEVDVYLAYRVVKAPPIPTPPAEVQAETPARTRKPRPNAHEIDVPPGEGSE